jgi:hypothetical protein
MTTREAEQLAELAMGFLDSADCWFPESSERVAYLNHAQSLFDKLHEHGFFEFASIVENYVSCNTR